jgi:hypothetical protein
MDFISVQEARPVSRHLLSALAVASALTLAACGDSDPVAPAAPDDPGQPEPPAGPSWDSLTVDASASWAYVSFDGATAAPTSVGSPASSEAWDMAFFATSVMLNGGAAGPGGVVGHCLCENAELPEDEIAALDPEAELADFEAITLADVPSDEEAWQSDALAPAIDGWYSYDFQTHTISAEPEAVYAVRTASGEAFAKFHVTEIADAGRSHAGTVTFRYALQPSAGAPFDSTRTETLDLSQGDVYWDLESGAAVDASAEWDLLFQGYDIRVNGGVSGDGEAGALLMGQPFDDVTDASGAPARIYAGDAFGGVFDGEPWYRYNIQGQNQIWPTYDIYLIQRGDAVYKVQVVNYYGPTGDSRQITFRYELLS